MDFDTPRILFSSPEGREALQKITFSALAPQRLM